MTSRSNIITRIQVTIDNTDRKKNLPPANNRQQFDNKFSNRHRGRRFRGPQSQLDATYSTIRHKFIRSKWFAHHRLWIDN